MKCTNHKTKNAAGTCTNCGSPFCSDCMIKAGRKNICKDCAGEKLGEAKEEGNKQPQQIVITQQTTNNNNNNMGDGRLRGSGFWLCFWILVFWPIAIWYYINRSWK